MYWTGVIGVGSTGAVGGKCHNIFVRDPHEAPLYIYIYIPFTILKFRVCIIGRVLNDFRTPLFQLIVVMKGLE